MDNAPARWHIGTKANVLQFLMECKRPRDNVSDGIAAIEDEQGITDWDVCVLECRICGARHTGVVTHGTYDDNMECSNCGNMTADVVRGDE